MPIDFDDIFFRSHLHLRRMQSGDEVFLESVFRSTREGFLQLNLPASVLEPMLRQQYQLQQQAYRQQWPDASCWVIQQMGLPVGKLMLAQTSDALHLVDIAFVAEARGKGMGRALLKTIQDAATQHQLAVTLSVDNQNLRARKLYEILGFVVTGASATHDFLRWDFASA